MRRSLIHHRGTHLTVALAAAVVTAVLTGALMMGDSVQGSLRDLALERLGDVNLALVSPRFFRARLADDMAAQPGFPSHFAAAAPAVSLAGAAVHAGSGRRASSIRLYGVDARFLAMTHADFEAPARQPGRLPGVVINAALAAELGAAEGDDLLLSFARFDEVPRDSLLGRRETDQVTGRLRLTVAAVVPDRDAARFGLSPHQGAVLNAFVDLGELQRRLEREGEANMLLLSRVPGAADDAAADAGALQAASRMLRAALQPEDVALELRTLPGVIAVESGDFVLRPPLAEAVAAAADSLGWPRQPIQTYLANAIRAGQGEVPYSTVAAVDGPSVREPFAPLRLGDGRPAPVLEEGEVLLGAWAAADLHVAAGATVAVDYFVVGPRDELTTASTEFTVAGVLAADGPGLDPSLTPDYPGIADAEDISAWDPPFPVDLSRVREKDEDYWDEHKGAPKAFFAPAQARRLWGSRYGALTSIRVAPPATGEAAQEALGRAIIDRLDLEPFGLVLRPVRAEGLEAARGATDFAGLFLAFSLFLVISAVLLVALLFGLGVERRAGEIGLLLAVGFPIKAVRRRFMGEALLVAAAGVAVGVALGTAYAAGLMQALRTVWRPAVGSSALFLHAGPGAMLLGAGLSLVAVLLAVSLTLRRISRLPPPALLAGRSTLPAAPRRRRATPVLAWGGLLLAPALTATALATGRGSDPGLSFGTGAGLLVSGLAFFALWSRRRSRGAAMPGLLGMAARNSAWSPGRSLLSLALVACATFVIVTVAANRHGEVSEAGALPPGSGGFELLAETSVPIYQDLTRPEGRFDLGLAGEAEPLLAATRIVPLRVLPGSDASCLNLYAPRRPTLLGVPADLGSRSRFAFGARLDDSDDPWSLLQQEIEPGVIPAFGDANSVQWILHLGLGRDLVMEDELGRPLRLRLVGLLQKSIFQSQLLIGEDDFRRHFPSRGGYGAYLLAPPPGGADEVAAVLESGLERYGFDAESTRRRLAEYAAVENTYLSTFQTLGGLGLLLGTLGLGIVLLRNVMERRLELATLRACGFPRRRLGALVLAETSVLLLLGVGIGAGAGLLAVLPRSLSGDLHLPWGSLLATLGLVILVGLVSCLAAVGRALRAPLLAALKSDR